MECGNSKEEGELSEDENDAVQVIMAVRKEYSQLKATNEIIIIDDDPAEVDTPVVIKKVAEKKQKPLSVVNRTKDTTAKKINNEKKKKLNSSKPLKHKKEKNLLENSFNSKKRNKRYYSTHTARFSDINDRKSSSSSKLEYGVYSTNTGIEERKRKRTQRMASGKLGDLLQYRKTKHGMIETNTESKSNRKGSSSVSSAVGINSNDASNFNNEIPPLPKSPPPCPPLPPPMNKDEARTSSLQMLSPKQESVDETTYAHLLLEYNQIREKLKQINKEEENADVTDEEVIKGEGTQSESSVLHENNETKDMEDKTEVVDMELASTDEEENLIQALGQSDTKCKDDEDEELYLLELRRAALASAALTQKKKLEQQENTLSLERDSATLSPGQSHDHQRISPKEKKYPKLTNQRRTRSNSQRDDHSRLSRQGWQEKEWIRREKERITRAYEKLHKAEDDMARERERMLKDHHERHVREELWLYEIRRLLSIDDQEVRYHRVLDLFDIDERAAIKSSPPRDKDYRRCNDIDERIVFSSALTDQDYRGLYSQSEPYYNDDDGNIGQSSLLQDQDYRRKYPKEQHIPSYNRSRTPSPHRTMHRQRKYSDNTSMDRLTSQCISPERRNSTSSEHREYITEYVQESTHKSTPDNTLVTNDVKDESVSKEYNTVNNINGSESPADVDNNECDEDEEMLRAQLLASVAQKRREKEQKQQEKIREEEALLTNSVEGNLVNYKSVGQNDDPLIYDEVKETQYDPPVLHKSSSSVSLSSQYNIDDLRKKSNIKKSHIQIPIHKPVIIEFNDDSSDEDDEAEPPIKLQKCEGPDVPGGGLLDSLDSFLKDVRRSVEEKSSDISPESSIEKPEPPTPEALKHLGSYHIEEYKKLKEEIKKRESRKELKKKNSDLFQNMVVTIGKENDADNGGRNENRKVEVKVEDTRLKDPIISRQKDTESLTGSEVKLELSEKETSNKKKEDSERQATKEELERQTKIKQIKQLGLKAELQKKLLETDQQRMNDVKGGILKKKAIVKTTEQKVQKFREQMLAAQTLCKANLEQIATLNEEAQEIQFKMDQRKLKFLSLEKEMMDLRVKVYGSDYTSFLVKAGDSSDTRLVQVASPASSNAIMKNPSYLKVIKPNKPVRNINPSLYTSHNNATEIKLTTQKNMSQRERNDKKAMLEKQAKMLALAIQRYKEKQELLTGVNINKKANNRKEPMIQIQQRMSSRNAFVQNNDSVNVIDSSSKRRRSWTSSKLRKKPLKEPEHVETEETMSVKLLETPDEIVTINPKRRKSLIDSSKDPVTRPNLVYSQSSPMKEKTIIKTSSKYNIKSKEDEQGSSREASPIPSVKPSTSNTVTDQHLTNLCRLHNENLSQASVSCSRTTVNMYRQNLTVTQQSISVIPDMKYQPRITTKENNREDLSPFGEYSSPLLRFKSYRFSPYFRTKCKLKLSTVTHSNSIKAGKILCRFDVTGKCNDEKCPWQHQSDYEMNNEELFHDLLSYSPELAGIIDTTPVKHYQILIKQHTELFSQQNNKMTTDEQSILLVSQINQKTKHVPPHTTHFEERKWRPIPIFKRLSDDRDYTAYENGNVQFINTKSKQGKLSEETEDDIICDQDVRYWMLATDEVNDMETAVIDNPKDVPMWIKLAYKKLHNGHSGEMGLDLALSVLSRSLEANKENSELWLQYLRMYERRSDHRDLDMLCKQSLQYAPAYDLYWKYLKLLPSCAKKLQLCQKIMEFLCSKETLQNGMLSHQLLEVILYQVQMLISTGRLKTAVQIMQDALKSGRVKSKLCQKDLVLGWLCLIHLIELNSLPKCLFNPSHSIPGHVVNKEPFVIPWQSCDTKKSFTKRKPQEAAKPVYLSLCSLFQEALLCCQCHDITTTGKRQHSEDGSTTADVNSEALFPIYKNFVLMHLTNNSNEEARNMCKQLTDQMPELPDVWSLAADVEFKSGDLQAAKEILHNSISKLPYEPVLSYALVSMELSQHHTDEALEILETCPFSFYQVDANESESKLLDPNHLYSNLLKQNVPVDFIAPKLKSELPVDHLKGCQLHLWLNYCLLLELQGFSSAEVSELYESALSSMRNVPDLRHVWKSYLQYKYRQLQNNHTKNSKTFFDLIHRCLIAMPTKFPLPYAGASPRYWLDYSFHNDVLDFFTGCLSKDQKTVAYEELLKFLPANVELIIRACQHFYNEGYVSLAFGCCTIGLEDHPKCLELYKLYLSFANHLGNTYQIRQIYRRACQELPYSIWLWKNYLLFEASSKRPDFVKQLLQKCQEFGINISDFVSTVLRF